MIQFSYTAEMGSPHTAAIAEVWMIIFRSDITLSSGSGMAKVRIYHDLAAKEAGSTPLPESKEYSFSISLDDLQDKISLFKAVEQKLLSNAFFANGSVI